MARYEDYLPKPEGSPVDGTITDEITDSDQVQQARQENSTLIDWEERYKNLEKLNSQQAQVLGEYRKVIDSHILGDSPTSTEPEPVQESKPLTFDDLADDPDSALNAKIESHPAVREARKIKEMMEQQRQEAQLGEFQKKHPDYQELTSQPEFAEWVQSDGTRLSLAERANSWDLSAADALFSLFKAEKGIAQITAQRDEAAEIDAATLEESSSQMVPDAPRYSRTEYVKYKQRANQGDLDAQDWVNRNAAAYRQALMSGQVRD